MQERIKRTIHIRRDAIYYALREILRGGLRHLGGNELSGGLCNALDSVSGRICDALEIDIEVSGTHGCGKRARDFVPGSRLLLVEFGSSGSHALVGQGKDGEAGGGLDGRRRCRRVDVRGGGRARESRSRIGARKCGSSFGSPLMRRSARLSGVDGRWESRHDYRVSGI